MFLNRLTYFLKPRYHFCGDEVFVERRPFRNHKVLQESNRPVTRLLCLANVDNKNKQKWLYAFSITPSSMMDRVELVKQPDGTTENPFSFPSEWEDKSVIGKSQFFYDTQYNESNAQRGSGNRKRKHPHNQVGEYGEGDRKKHQEGGEKKQQSIKCWFCLASPEVEKHLIASIGDFCYIALPKGGLVPDHCMIIPIDHFR